MLYCFPLRFTADAFFAADFRGTDLAGVFLRAGARRLFASLASIFDRCSRSHCVVPSAICIALREAKIASFSACLRTSGCLAASFASCFRIVFTALFMRAPSAFQVSGDFGELGQSGLEVFYDFAGQHVGIGEVGAVFEAFVFEPEDVEVGFIALEKL